MPLPYVELRDVLSAEQCDRLIKLFGGQVQPSMVGVDASSRHISPKRTSSSVKIEPSQLPQDVREALLNRIASLTNLPVENQEKPEIIRYNVGQHFSSHYDFLPRVNAGGQRIFSVVVTLAAPDKGGELVFQAAKLRFTPERGKLVMWRNADETGGILRESMHASFRVIQGTKWSLVTWVRAQRVQF